jgi:hypothetical protein
MSIRGRTTQEITGKRIETIPVGTVFEIIHRDEWSTSVKGLGVLSLFNDEYEIIGPEPEPPLEVCKRIGCKRPAPAPTDVSELKEIINNRIIQAAADILPSRFLAEKLQDKPVILICDTRTGRELEVGICNARGAYQALAAFCDD